MITKNKEGVFRTININYTYYENYDLLNKVISYYEPFKDDPNFDFTIIDDGSQTQPLSRSVVPEWWKLYRVKEDLGWGNEMCRNLLMRLTPYEWNALMDLDYVIKLDDTVTYKALTQDFIKYYRNLNDLLISFQFKNGRRVEYDDYTKVVDDPPDSFTSINSFIISRTCFLKTTGYDQAFGYTYGYDFTLFEQLDKELAIPDTTVVKLAAQVAKEGSRPPPGDQSAFNDLRRLQLKYSNQGVYSTDKGWINELERAKRCTPLPPYEIL